MHETRLYKCWQNMKTRCYNKKNKGYPNYGARGIKVCDEWQQFVPFYKWAIANGYDDDLELDRIDNDGSYTPDNCRFVTHTENNRNRRNNRLITAFGETKCMQAWIADERCKVETKTLQGRLDGGWPAEIALKKPASRGKWLTAFGETKMVKDWMDDKRCQVCREIFNRRLRMGWTIEKALTEKPMSHVESQKLSTIARKCNSNSYA